ncbi:uncharacterized protein Nmag_1125 [Natrialba magadii ATCC 43099]|uniref:DUF8108 domain-containing protein n=1 Tax=Natrialba magadii (strain ATCC 43099 / DSM 3394 / CCM 3739 / CIP 104546 / IAM 13178 / JCM 8861 / NBRC 102185 / NCIMB 2190 / MS3) TaxID=547559 RepID=D3SRK4_NATMM|nr:hypothetical protein [Natrialba magadii]ADD04709.1 uncharacterized protein Nmag_1125 [Natrialba magadii ATCC 43099]ELY25365.1 hypothetical protein C500_18146 [Natrialba magadii ATCC 43099]
MSDSNSAVVALADTVSELLYGIVGWLLIGLGLFAAVTVSLNAIGDGLAGMEALLTALMLAVSFVFVALGIFVNPRLRRRLSRRHSLSTFGRVQSVDQRVIRPEEDCTERCVACQSPIEKGMVRRYRTEFALAGVPVYTDSVGHNHYCLACAAAELQLPDAIEAEEIESGNWREAFSEVDGSTTTDSDSQTDLATKTTADADLEAETTDT